MIPLKAKQNLDHPPKITHRLSQRDNLPKRTNTTGKSKSSEVKPQPSEVSFKTPSKNANGNAKEESEEEKEYRWIVALVLVCLFGYLGAHRFYLDHDRMGRLILYSLLAKIIILIQVLLVPPLAELFSSIVLSYFLTFFISCYYGMRSSFMGSYFS